MKSPTPPRALSIPVAPPQRVPAYFLLPILLALYAVAAGGCARHAKPAPGSSNLIFRDAAGAEVARGWLELPSRLPKPGKSFGGEFKLVSSRGGFPDGATQKSGRYVAFVGEGGTTLSFNLNPTVADNNVTLAGQLNGDDVRGNWTVSTLTGLKLKPGGTFVLAWPAN